MLARADRRHRGRKPVSYGSAEIPSDVDGLYGILERTRELADPQIDHYELDRDLGHTPDSRADTAVWNCSPNGTLNPAYLCSL